MHMSPAYTTYETRQGPFELLVSLDHQSIASSKVYIDDGQSLTPIFAWLEFEVDQNHLRGQKSNHGHHQLFMIDQLLERITLVGGDQIHEHDNVVNFKLNQKSIQGKVSSGSHAWVLDGLSLDINQSWDLSWS